MHTFSLLMATTVALAASIPERPVEDVTTSGSPIRRSAEPGIIQLHKTVIPDWVDDVYVAPQTNRHQDTDLLFHHQGNVTYNAKVRQASQAAIRVDAVDVPMYAETYPSPGVERYTVSRRRSESPSALGGRVPTCTRKPGKLHTQRQWSISYDYDNKYNGMHCGQSVRKALKSFKKCRPTTDWTCVRSGEQGLGGVTIEFHTPRGCDDKRIHEVMKKATRGQVDVWCQHR
ncbi:hypothetical protein QBC40DRAFT_45566 [Triangularia verruculosa]|uniref:Uncharacterized protein n=1 Tax=Triangularia verruculosa TaxID=2587418 RepID=A0AAN6XM22_9PEZI|nr:hypothetical protein QBC40DRAFT_45566 [Triangularia verruculosa]